MAIVVGIEGTGGGTIPGRSRNARYDVDFANSFVKRITASGPHKQYHRGPVTLGGGLMDAIAGGVRFIEQKRRDGIQDHICLTGYSRGAAGAVVIAKRLKKKGIPVEALLLFDCVDRHLFIDADVIPDNVRNVMHVVRDPRSKSSVSFSNDGLRYHPASTNYPAAYKFLCTHGGMGGTPWKMPAGKRPTDLIDEGFPDGMTTISYANDALVSAQVWNFVQPFIRQYGFM